MLNKCSIISSIMVWLSAIQHGSRDKINGMFSSLKKTQVIVVGSEELYILLKDFLDDS